MSLRFDGLNGVIKLSDYIVVDRSEFNDDVDMNHAANFIEEILHDEYKDDMGFDLELMVYDAKKHDNFMNHNKEFMDMCWYIITEASEFTRSEAHKGRIVLYPCVYQDNHKTIELFNKFGRYLTVDTGKSVYEISLIKRICYECF
jgi:tagatose-1,6-bisphosphate aldolase